MTFLLHSGFLKFNEAPFPVTFLTKGEYSTCSSRLGSATPAVNLSLISNSINRFHLVIPKGVIRSDSQALRPVLLKLKLHASLILPVSQQARAHIEHCSGYRKEKNEVWCQASLGGNAFKPKAQKFKASLDYKASSRST